MFVSLSPAPARDARRDFDHVIAAKLVGGLHSVVYLTRYV